MGTEHSIGCGCGDPATEIGAEVGAAEPATSRRAGVRFERTEQQGPADEELAELVTLLDGASSRGVACTLDGGMDALRGRVNDWAHVVGQAIGREPADGGITLAYNSDPAIVVDLARLAAAEFSCCSFFTFTLTVGPAGTRFTVTAPAEARDVLTAVFGTTATRTPVAAAGGNR